MEHISAYFAVAKSDGKTARAIINLREVSKLFEPPETVNLPEIQSVLQNIRGHYWVVADFRHYFHQFALAKGIRPYFGVSCGKKTYQCTTMAMGWSNSPRIAQCAAWGLVLEACFRCSIVKPEDFEAPNPPAYINIPGVCFIVIWYDNLLATFESPVLRDQFLAAIKDVCGPQAGGFNCDWKHINAYNMGNIGKNSLPKNMPKYLGMEFATQPIKRMAEDAGPTKEIVWRHEEERTGRWADIDKMHTLSPPRMLARAVGIILWDATIANRKFFAESTVIEALRRAGGVARKARRFGWDATPSQHWDQDEIDMLKDRVKELVVQNPWRARDAEARITHKVYAASDASGKIGWGVVVWVNGVCRVLSSGLWANNEKMTEAHIYLKEFLALTVAVERLCETHCSAELMILVDNTAVIGSVQCMYSSNTEGCAYVQRIDKALRAAGNKLSVVAVQSEDNPADAPSRQRGLDAAIIARSLKIFREYECGAGKNTVRHKPGPAFTGEIRHPVPEDDEPMKKCPELLLGDLSSAMANLYVGDDEENA